MVGLNVDGFGLVIPRSRPEVLFSASATTSVFVETYEAPSSAGCVLVLGIDATATEAEPIQCFVDIVYNGGPTFYHDSQSTGEGLGVTWTWRGQIPLLYPQKIVFAGSTESGTIQWGLLVWGLSLPSQAVPGIGEMAQY